MFRRNNAIPKLSGNSFASFPLEIHTIIKGIKCCERKQKKIKIIHSKVDIKYMVMKLL